MARRRRAEKKNPSDLSNAAISVAGFLAMPIVGGFLARASLEAFPPDGVAATGPTGALATRTTVIDGLGAVASMFAWNTIRDPGLQQFVRAGTYGLLFGALLNPTVAAARTLQLAPAVARPDAVPPIERT